MSISKHMMSRIEQLGQRWRRKFGQAAKWNSWGLSRNWLRVSSRLGAARLDKPMGWEGIAAARRAMRRCVSLCEWFGMTRASVTTA